jgi:hypothetical protein
MARTHLNIFVRFFGSSGSFLALSTIETMSGRLRIAPKPPPKPSYALMRASTVAGDPLKAADLAIRTIEMVRWLCTSLCTSADSVHK